MRMLDHIRRHGFHVHPRSADMGVYAKPFIDLPDLPAFEVTNVFQYWKENMPHGFDYGMLPNVAPPFDHWWSEYQIQGRMRVGLLHVVTPPDEWGRGDNDGVRWRINSLVFITKDERYFTIEGCVGLNVKADGSVFGARQQVLPADDEHKENEWLAALNNTTFPSLFAVALSHLRNVQAVQEPSHPRPLNKRQIQATGLPLTRYRTLVIETARKLLAQSGVAEVGLARALHICRGHFADYTEGAGLFGKLKGRFWIPAHARGTAAAGTILKDYKVKTPK